MFRATDLARYIIAYENQLSRQIDITNLRLQKTLYYIQGYYFKHYNRCAFEEKFITGHMGLLSQKCIIFTIQILIELLLFLMRQEMKLLKDLLIIQKEDLSIK